MMGLGRVEGIKDPKRFDFEKDEYVDDTLLTDKDDSLSNKMARFEERAKRHDQEKPITTVSICSRSPSKQPLKVNQTFIVEGGIFQVYNVKPDGRVWLKYLGEPA